MICGDYNMREGRAGVRATTVGISITVEVTQHGGHVFPIIFISFDFKAITLRLGLNYV